MKHSLLSEWSHYEEVLPKEINNLDYLKLDTKFLQLFLIWSLHALVLISFHYFGLNFLNLILKSLALLSNDVLDLIQYFSLLLIQL